MSPKHGPRGRTRLASLAVGCASFAAALACGGPARQPEVAAPATRADDGAAASARLWTYQVEAGPRASELRVAATLPAGVPALLGVDHFAEPYLRELEASTGHGWVPVPRRGRFWWAPQCRAVGCRLRYSYELGRAAEQIDRFNFAAYRGGALVAPPSTWLLHPQDYAGDDLYRFSVATAPGDDFASGVWSVAEGVFEAPAAVLFQAPYAAFGNFRQERLSIGSGEIRLFVSRAEDLQVSPDALRSAVVRAGEAVSAYFERFPVPALALLVLPIKGDEIFGMQLGNGGASVLLFIGRRVTDAELAEDWVMGHELFHLGFPTLARRHLWLAEGLATYQEAVSRARAGRIDEAELWRILLTGMRKGLASEGEVGLNGNTSWGRIYWGGALFCLLADVALRAGSNNRVSLDEAARGILRAGGDTSMRWSVQQTLAAADRALANTTLSELYREHAEVATPIDLEVLWQRLGVREAGGRITSDESAELAHVRRAISEPTLEPASGPSRAREPQGAQGGFAAPGVPKSPL